MHKFLVYFFVPLSIVWASGESLPHWLQPVGGNFSSPNGFSDKYSPANDNTIHGVQATEKYELIELNSIRALSQTLEASISL